MTGGVIRQFAERNTNVGCQTVKILDLDMKAIGLDFLGKSSWKLNLVQNERLASNKLEVKRRYADNQT